MSERLARFLGDTPGRVALKLAVVSVAVGLVLAALDLDPERLVRMVWFNIVHFFDWLRYIGLDAVEAVIRWFFYGAVIVVPLFLVMRLFQAKKS